MLTKYKYDFYKTPVGCLNIIVDENDNLFTISFNHDKPTSIGLSCEIERASYNPTIIKTKEWLDSYFKKESVDFNIDLDKLNITEFQKAVYTCLLKVRFGQITTYKKIGDEVKKLTNKKVSYQAIGTALSKNPLLILIPCHRVIKTNGSLGGYAGGIPVKMYLLNHER